MVNLVMWYSHHCLKRLKAHDRAASATLQNNAADSSCNLFSTVFIWILSVQRPAVSASCSDKLCRKTLEVCCCLPMHLQSIMMKNDTIFYVQVTYTSVSL